MPCVQSAQCLNGRCSGCRRQGARHSVLPENNFWLCNSRGVFFTDKNLLRRFFEYAVVSCFIVRLHCFPLSSEGQNGHQLDIRKIPAEGQNRLGGPNVHPLGHAGIENAGSGLRKGGNFIKQRSFEPKARSSCTDSQKQIQRAGAL